MHPPIPAIAWLCNRCADSRLTGDGCAGVVRVDMDFSRGTKAIVAAELLFGTEMMKKK